MTPFQRGLTRPQGSLPPYLEWLSTVLGFPEPQEQLWPTAARNGGSEGVGAPASPSRCPPRDRAVASQPEQAQTLPPTSHGLWPPPTCVTLSRVQGQPAVLLSASQCTVTVPMTTGCCSVGQRSCGQTGSGLLRQLPRLSAQPGQQPQHRRPSHPQSEASPLCPAALQLETKGIKKMGENTLYQFWTLLSEHWLFLA